MNPDGTNPRQLTTDVHADRDPSVSPDNRYITFASDRSGKFNIWRMDSDGNNQKKITDGDDEEFPQISPDGHSVVYQGFVNGYQPVAHYEDGSKPVQLTNSYSNWPVVSPDGKWIACSYLDEESARWKLAVFPFDGGAPTKTFDMPMPYLQHFVWQKIRWTADGQALTYIDRRGGISNIWSPAAKWRRSAPTKPTSRPIRYSTLPGSADGKQLACARGVVTSDAVLISEFK
jgi:Tol biopolymer transport system component